MSEQIDDVQVVRSSGDIYNDLNVPHDVKDGLKNAIAREICSLIEDKRLTQKQVADILGTDQAKVSKITRGRLTDFSVDRLVNFLTALGYNIDIHLERTMEKQGRVKLHTPMAAVG
ncbi:helix-turn-helix domain-containing protein [Aquibium oceanicum]|uniref:HTH cro/C1-type domain-containing protein n=1 Tax=Aquibium oceanicum TaxID=1670800 RepID=A0A1L3SXD0_9HYPH|nr:helix-turn-helix transcriptional regulator [Aquibium oceanicum]APH74087.1 hypothetical protein BSQ44_24005 [Aquibium oceanicum]